MTIEVLQRQLAQAQATILELQAELAKTNQGLVALTMELEQRVEERTAALAGSEKRYQRLVKLAPIPLCFVNKDGELSYFNDRFFQVFGYTHDDVPTLKKWWQLAYPDEQYRSWVVETWESAVRQASETNTDIEPIEHNVTCKNGTVRVVVISGITIEDNFLATFIDITERKRAEEHLAASLQEKEVLLKEIHHRVKNNLQVISSLVNLQANTLDNPDLRDLFQDVRDRVRSIAMVHEKLYQSESLARVDFADYARSLLNHLWRAYGSLAATIRLKLDLQPVSFSVETAVPCGLILNELAINALKHAFRGRSEGEVTTALHTGPDGRVCLSVRDNGVGLPTGLDWRQSRSLGLQLVQMLARQLNGAVDARSEGGTEFQITFELPEPKKHEEKKRE